MFGAAVVTFVAAVSLAGTESGLHTFYFPGFFSIVKATFLLALLVGYVSMLIYFIFGKNVIPYIAALVSALNLFRAFDWKLTNEENYNVGGGMLCQLYLVLIGMSLLLR